MIKLIFRLILWSLLAGDVVFALSYFWNWFNLAIEDQGRVLAILLLVTIAIFILSKLPFFKKFF